ncbi:branched-chain amino acid ABC transporter permease [Sedimentibacter hydroxybenzoicus DSM 7310]|uniref:Branched-chain amino acid ABC transporter permease n=1 Tax=Sedimentibacter hydroxybenzoicus DSM 7310 TaxID=1123245 RepID=A0A974GY30_SEDHY|nr:branched-chain amino acid ABC transporter permease [Sedimentibacter hydroxybenzoicus]NYB75700.1 branched-chain amino acid ABC transporter permease [Sedimentibacter hydroxybenzoicus DSM 7310]
MDIFLTLFINGLSEGALIFLVSSGLAIILGLMGVVNFAHGALFVWGGYAYVWIYQMTNSFILGILAAMLIVFILGIIFEKFFVSRLYGNAPAQILITLGLNIVFIEIIRLIWGNTPIAIKKPDFISGTTIINGVTISHYRILLIIIGISVLIIVNYILKNSKTGMVIRAGVQRSDMVQALGINIRLYFTIVFAAGAALAGLGGALYAPLAGNVISTAGANNQILAFIAIVIGGLGNFSGTAKASFLLGLMNAFVAWFIPSFAVVTNVLVMAIVLAFKPEGLFSEGRKSILRLAVKK